MGKDEFDEGLLPQEGSGNRANLKYVDPSTQNHRDYFDHLQAYNRGVHRRLARRLSDGFSSRLYGSSLATTGSDARLEKGPVSMIELLLFANPDVRPEGIVGDLRHYFSDVEATLNLEGIEAKDIESGKLYELILEGPDRETPIRLVSPNRVFDARFVAGNEEVFQRGKFNLGLELIGPEGKRVFGRVKDKCKEHLRVTERGTQRYKGEEVLHFDLEGGISYYDPENGLHSFKQGPLRAVQYALVRDSIGKIRSAEEDKFEEITSDVLAFPINTVNKLNHLEVEGISALSYDELRDLTDSYKYFLWLYHQSQKSFSERNVKMIGFDSGEVRERLSAVRQIAGKNIMKIAD